MNTISKWLMALALLAGPVIASAADAVIYNFTGVITSSTQSTLIGAAVHGSYTFTYNSADIITGTVGSSSSWEIQESPTPPNNFPPLNLLVGNINNRRAGG